MHNLVCPKSKSPLLTDPSGLISEQGAHYPIADGIPVLLLDDVPQTIELAKKSLLYGRGSLKDEISHFYLESVGLTDEERHGIVQLARTGANSIDPVVSYLIGATNGIAYKELIGKLKSYPIPEIPLPSSQGSSFLDIGCNWGRWSIAAARKGYSCTGIDPSLGAVAAGKRVCKALDAKADFVCGDARFLPFKNESFDVVFSYSVLQHMSRENVLTVIQEISRVLKSGGAAYIQMPNVFGLRCLFHQAKRRFREARNFEVRYWTLVDLHNLFSSNIGTTSFFIDCFFGLGLQASDMHMMSRPARFATRCSETLKSISRSFKALSYLADSIYVKAVKSGTV